jgi:hypothetical protein
LSVSLGKYARLARGINGIRQARVGLCTGIGKL